MNKAEVIKAFAAGRVLAVPSCVLTANEIVAFDTVDQAEAYCRAQEDEWHEAVGVSQGHMEVSGATIPIIYPEIKPVYRR